MTNKTRIIFRADGNSKIGLGHVVRSLALASMLREEFECVFAIQSPDKNLQEQIKQVCHGLILLPFCTPEAERFRHELDAYLSEKEIVVLDGYHFETAYQESIKAKGCPFFCIDDIHRYTFIADAVLNQAGGVAPEKYKTAPYTKLLLGPAYALLRPPFLQASKSGRSMPASPLKLLLNMGGADPENYTLQVATELAGVESINHIEIVTGGAYKHQQALERWLTYKPKYKLYQNLDATQMCQLMQECAIAVTSASGVAYEYAAVGGALFVLKTADNQQALFEFLTDSGIAGKYEPGQKCLKQSINQAFQEYLQAQRQYFDGQSDIRLRQVFGQLSLAASLSLREATETDLLLVYKWNNDPEVRRHSFNPEPIKPEHHTRWFQAKLADAACKFYIAEVAGEPAAQIRFEVKEKQATISYLIAEAYRGKGLGHKVLLKGVNKLKDEQPEIRQVHGLVQPENIASVRAFEKAGFAYAAPDPQHPQAHRFVLAL
ncbi:UDP-2,4-diacetamido-2,4,6-trideoxy-beta-L-altropyranose hydrolase [Pontibacter sp. 172403-2]|uniref:UDP-2,4-diacetamido-2,4, 6-trideoxy-beta-L-altropyranose hydrolase n=1 Tax=Pontibacter rufus TaxID=2791028 RepID=UPI0018B0010C|nr:UDP-2,4-diacetamido-2,4,6-trideoxy-beta-L-altropyranose hydrolase [Pontibacter sp. 172403-2]MBF9253779.1 UDP-2,4-diacetamido-2,4,6-trideoxy-beta-L-altropyranose hydrolase [Pontibacter sp. 172403-2]